MNMEKYTERTRGFVQSAQSLAIRDGHQQFTNLFDGVEVGGIGRRI
jgi:ATP-dependent Clp protease ATP-binding subunit ClpB